MGVSVRKDANVCCCDALERSYVDGGGACGIEFAYFANGRRRRVGVVGRGHLGAEVVD